MSEKVKSLPLAPKQVPWLQKIFDELELWRFASDGTGPKEELQRILEADIKTSAAEKARIDRGEMDEKNKTGGLLEYTFNDRHGHKTNFLAELIRNEKGPLALMVLKNFKGSIPDLMVKGYKPDPESPELNLLELALKNGAPDVAIELIKQQSKNRPQIELISTISANGENIFHTMMASSSPTTAEKMLSYLDKNIPPEQLKELLSQKANNKTPLQMMGFPDILVPFLKHQHLSTDEVKKTANTWLNTRRDDILAINWDEDKRQYYRHNHGVRKEIARQEILQLSSEIIAMHRTLHELRLKHKSSYSLGEKLIGFCKKDQEFRYGCTLQMNELCNYASYNTKNAWLESAVPLAYENFPLAHLILDKGARPTDQDVLLKAIYAEDIQLTRRLLDICKNNPAFLDSAAREEDEEESSALKYALTCDFVAKQKRLPIAALLIERGAKVNDDTYFSTIKQKIAEQDIIGQEVMVENCRKNCLPYPKEITKVLEAKWCQEDKKQPAAEEIIKKRSAIKKLLNQWETDSKMQKLLKNALSSAPTADIPDFSNAAMLVTKLTEKSASELETATQNVLKNTSQLTVKLPQLPLGKAAKTKQV